MMFQKNIIKSLRIKIKGKVQGVGFRPFVYNLAKSLSLSGYVKNSSKGVVIEVEGDKVDDLLDTIRKDPPPLARIESIETETVPFRGYDDFKIIESEDEGSFTHISPDVSICDDCLRELLDPNDRRYLYPFINCTNCGPRYSITTSLPYDRPNTTMRVFRMCSACEREYNDPSNRRFHAQPNACPECGPSLSLKITNEAYNAYKDFDPLEGAIRIINSGGIVAIKGIGGFHIACNAENRDAVRLLRQRKRRSNKPFALMASDIDTIRLFCSVTTQQQRLLRSRQRPIVLLRKLSQCKIPEEVAPKNSYLGFMLPYTPLHYLLFKYPLEEEIKYHCLVMTSGNLSEEPIIHENNAAIERLSSFVDAFLLHNRDIFMRVDDSVIKGGFFVRRSRGYVPDAIPLKDHGPEVLGVGADIKNTFTLTKESYAVPSQHIGDMENYETLLFFEEVLENLKKVYRVNPEAIGADLHPGYYTTRWAEEQGLQVFRLQHHYAHVASVMAEAGLMSKVIGVAFDGSGYGTDGTIWGGEFLLADLHGFERVGYLCHICLPGGEMAIKEPWRIAVGLIKSIFGDRAMDYLERLGFTEKYTSSLIENIFKLMKLREYSPLSSGAGRLFDAVSAILGIVDRNSFEAEAAIALESCTMDGINETYPYDIRNEGALKVDLYSVIRAIVEDHLKGVNREVISTIFHNTMAEVIIDVVERLYRETIIRDVALSGGVFQNHYLTERVIQGLKERGFNVYFNRLVPPNDACISLGQAYIVRERLR